MNYRELTRWRYIFYSEFVRISCFRRNWNKNEFQKKYNINSDDLIYTYEVFKGPEKALYELNTLFSQKK